MPLLPLWLLKMSHGSRSQGRAPLLSWPVLSRAAGKGAMLECGWSSTPGPLFTMAGRGDTRVPGAGSGVLPVEGGWGDTSPH